MNEKKHRYNTLTYILAAFIILAAIFGVYAAGVYQIYHFNGDMTIPDGDGDGDNAIVTFLPDKDGYIYTANGQKVTIDMGSRHCFITSKSLKLLKEAGYDIREQQTLIYTTDQSGHYRIYTRKVVMPVFLFKSPGSDDVVVFNNVELLISDKEEGNVLGMDFLERFIIERNNDDNTIALLRNVPDGFTYVCDINSQESAIRDLFGYSRRCYIPLRVNDDSPQNYYFDTGRGIKACELVQPLKNVSKATSKVYVDSVTGLMTQENCRVLVGNRMRFARVTYSDSLHTDEYSINPFRVFNSSIVMDLPSKKLYYKVADNPQDSITAAPAS